VIPIGRLQRIRSTYGITPRRQPQIAVNPNATPWSIYGFYLLYLGASPTMGVPRDRAVPYTVALVVAVIVLWIIVAVIVGAVIGVGVLGSRI
jgi:hypothetical protein